MSEGELEARASAIESAIEDPSSENLTALRKTEAACRARPVPEWATQVYGVVETEIGPKLRMEEIKR